jgi:hypothetical protein
VEGSAGRKIMGLLNVYVIFGYHISIVKEAFLQHPLELPKLDRNKRRTKPLKLAKPSYEVSPHAFSGPVANDIHYITLAILHALE